MGRRSVLRCRPGLRRRRCAAHDRRRAGDPRRSRPLRRDRRPRHRPLRAPLRAGLRERPRPGGVGRRQPLHLELRRLDRVRPHRRQSGDRRGHQRERDRGFPGGAGRRAGGLRRRPGERPRRPVRPRPHHADAVRRTPLLRIGREPRRAPRAGARPGRDAVVRRRRRPPSCGGARSGDARADRHPRQLRETGPGQLQNPYDVAVDDHDPAQLYVADNLNGRVDVFDAASLGFLGTFGHPG